MQVKAVGDQFEVFINGTEQPIITARDASYKSGSVGLRAYGALATMDNIAVKAIGR